MKRFIYLYFLILVLTFSTPVFPQETVELSTYYPEPAGVYITAVTNSIGVGDTNGVDGLTSDDAPSVDGDLWVAGDVGLGTGTNQLNNRLEVNGNAIIGSGAGIRRAPLNGIYISGNLGVGIVPEVDLEVNNSLKLIPVSEADVNHDDKTGMMYYNDDENLFKYKETGGGSWIAIGSGGGTLGDETTVISLTNISSNGSVSSYSENANGFINDCEPDHVIVGIEVDASGSCPQSCTWRAAALRKINLICKPVN